MARRSIFLGLRRFIRAVIFGVILGFLFAPKKGKELRKDIKEKLEDLKEKAEEAKEKFGEIKESVQEKFGEIKEGENLEAREEEKKEEKE